MRYNGNTGDKCKTFGHVCLDEVRSQEAGKVDSETLSEENQSCSLDENTGRSLESTNEATKDLAAELMGKGNSEENLLKEEGEKNMPTVEVQEKK